MRNLRFLAFVAICVLTGAIFFTVGCKKDAKAPLKDSENENLSSQGSSAFCGSGTARVSTANSTARSVTLNTTVYNTDFISAGISGLRNVGAGTIVLSGVSGTITQ